MKACIGIDPGVTGAVAAIVEHTPAALWDLPSRPAPGATRIRNVLDLQRLPDVLRAAAAVTGPCTVWVEDVRAFKVDTNAIQTVALQFITLGQLEGVCASLGLAVQRVHSQDWKRPFGLTNDKGDSRRVARALYPDTEELLARVRDADRAEALLIAHFGLRYGEAFLRRKAA